MAAAKKVKTRVQEKIKVLVADDDWQSCRRIHDFLSQNGFDSRMVHGGHEAKKLLLSWQPRVLIVDLLLPEANAFEIMRYAQHEPALRSKNIVVMVMSGHNNEDNIREAYQRGARDYLIRPVMYQDLLSRVVFHCRDQRVVEEEKNENAKHSIKIADLVVSQALQNLSMPDMLFHLTQMSALKVKGLRCSVVRQQTFEKGIVLASSDKKDIAGLPLDLRKYPEIQLVINTGKTVVIDNLDESKALSKIKADLKEINFNSMVVCPLYYHQKIFGVLSMRMPANLDRIPDYDIHFLDYVSKVISLYLSTQQPDSFGKYGLIPA